MNIFFILGIAQALFFCLILLTIKGNKFPNRLLSLWLSLIGFSLFLNYLYVSGKINELPHLIGLDTTFPFLYMPIFYYYAKFLVNPNEKLRISDALHLIPFVVYFLYVFINFYWENAQYKFEFLQRLRNFEYPLDIQISNGLKIGQAIIYLVLVYELIIKYQKTTELNFSNTESINLTWLKIIAICLCLIYSLKFIGVISIYFNSNSFLIKIDGISDLAIIIFVYVIAYFGIKQPEIFKKWKNTSLTTTYENSFDIVTHLKYKNSNLSESEGKMLLQNLQKYMVEEKPYLQNQLTIKEVADAINTNSKNISQVINEHLGLNFFNFINEYRIAEVKKRIIAKEYSHLSLFGIALDCGFNSKSSFNSVFKKHTGKTPTEYKSTLS